MTGRTRRSRSRSATAAAIRTPSPTVANALAHSTSRRTRSIREGQAVQTADFLRAQLADVKRSSTHRIARASAFKLSSHRRAAAADRSQPGQPRTAEYPAAPERREPDPCDRPPRAARKAAGRRRGRRRTAPTVASARTGAARKAPAAAPASCGAASPTRIPTSFACATKSPRSSSAASRRARARPRHVRGRTIRRPCPGRRSPMRTRSSETLKARGSATPTAPVSAYEAAGRQRAAAPGGVPGALARLRRDQGALRHAAPKRYEEAQLAESLEQGKKIEQFRILDAAMPPRFRPPRPGCGSSSWASLRPSARRRRRPRR